VVAGESGEVGNPASLGMTRRGRRFIESGCWTEAFFITLGGPQAHDSSVEKHSHEGSAELRPESSQEHLPTNIAGVLRLRAIKLSVYDRSAKRFAQDDGFVGGLEIQPVGYAENTKRSKKSQALLMTKRRVGVSIRNWFEGSQVSKARPGAPFDFPFDIAEGPKERATVLRSSHSL
jgi:hypothetical protein